MLSQYRTLVFITLLRPSFPNIRVRTLGFECDKFEYCCSPGDSVRLCDCRCWQFSIYGNRWSHSPLTSHCWQDKKSLSTSISLPQSVNLTDRQTTVSLCDTVHKLPQLKRIIGRITMITLNTPTLVEIPKMKSGSTPVPWLIASTVVLGRLASHLIMF